jgi:glutamate racemase
VRIGITDSGVGGLSVCAALEILLRRTPLDTDVEILYLNAALRDDYAYNAMPDRETKLRTFAGFLENAYRRYRPDHLYIACNSLSVLFRDPFFGPQRRVPVRGIVRTGLDAMRSALRAQPEAAVAIFATPTTVAEGTYLKALLNDGLAETRVVQQACPGLPDAISNDRSGGQARELLERFVPEALAQFQDRPDRLIAFLGCTHYGYQAGVFEMLLRDRIAGTTVLNPNPAAADDIVAWLGRAPGHGRLGVRVISPYRIPEQPMASLSRYLGDSAPATVSALHGFKHDPLLYGQPGSESSG